MHATWGQLPPVISDLLHKAEVEDTTLASLAQAVSVSEVKNRTSLVKPGEVCQHVYFILDGGFVCRYYDDEITDGKTVYFYLTDLHPFMACVDSYFTGDKTSLELKAIMDSRVASLKMDDLQPLMAKDVQLFKFFHSIVLRALLEETDFRVKLISFTSERLYRHLLKHFLPIVRQVPAKYIAEFMGISPEWLTKLKSRLRNS